MTPTPHSRRDVLKGAAAIAAAASVGTTSARRATAQGSARGADRRRPAAGRRRQGSAGRGGHGRDRQGRALRRGLRPARARPEHADDARHRLPHRLDDQGDHLGGGDAARRAGQAQGRGARAEHRPGAGLAPGAGGLRRRRRAQAATRQAADHAAPPADPHGRVQLRHLGRGHGPLHQGSGAARADHRASWRPSARRSPSIPATSGSTASTSTGRVASSRCSAASRSTSTSGTRSSRRSA